MLIMWLVSVAKETGSSAAVCGANSSFVGVPHDSDGPESRKSCWGEGSEDILSTTGRIGEGVGLNDEETAVPLESRVSSRVDFCATLEGRL